MSEHTVEIKAETEPRYTVEYVLEQMEKIAADTAYLHEAIRECSHGDGERALGLGNVVESRERTNQKMIAFYEGVYQDLKPKPVSGKERVAEECLKILRDPETLADDKDRAKSILREYMSFR